MQITLDRREAVRLMVLLGATISDPALTAEEETKLLDALGGGEFYPKPRKDEPSDWKQRLCDMYGADRKGFDEAWAKYEADKVEDDDVLIQCEETGWR